MLVVSLAHIRLDVGPACCCGHAEGTLDGVEGLAPGDLVLVVVDHPLRPVYEVKVALGDSAIVESFLG